MDPTTLRNTLIAIGAIIMAVETGLKGAPNFRSRLPNFIASEKWNFVPIILLMVAFAMWIYRIAEPPSTQEIAYNPSTNASIPESSPTPFQYQNPLPIPVLTTLIQQLNSLLRQSQRVTFVITAPPGAEQFKDDFNAIIVAACQGQGWGGAQCVVESNPDLAIDTDIPEPRYPGVVVHSVDPASRLGTVLVRMLGAAFIVHISGEIPESIRRLDPLTNDTNLVWFELGSGPPWHH